MQPPTSQIADALRQLSHSDALRELENRLNAQNAFNLFDAIGVSSQELRHSDFLAFLLRPNEAHGLGDTFLKWFLAHALANSPFPRISRDTLNQWDLTDAQVQREWNDIDLFITSPKNRLAVVIENKIYSGEREGQLRKYVETAEATGYGGADGIMLAIYLTLHGNKSSHPEYLPIGYEAVCTELERLCKTNAFTNAATADAETTVLHYTRMLRKRILGDPEITNLCHELYKKHQAAFDRVSAERFGAQQSRKNTTTILRQAVVVSSQFDADPLFFWEGIYGFHFVPRTWREDAKLNLVAKQGRLLYFQAETLPSGEIRILGLIAPSHLPIRQQIVDLLQARLSLIVPQPAVNGYAGFYQYTLRPESDTAITTEEATKLWEEWMETAANQFEDLIRPGDFPAI